MSVSADKSFDRWLFQSRERITWVLGQLVPAEEILPERLHQAMRYSVLSGGKRIRPLLVYGVNTLWSNESFDQPQVTLLDRIAAAVELIHAYSLIHDDLPAMDNDDLRRGFPTCHRAFDEATAILAGDALQALAFQILTEAPTAQWVPSLSDLKVRLVHELATAIGTQGMAGGQLLDLTADLSCASPTLLEQVYGMKTGSLIRASVAMAALAVGSFTLPQREALSNFAYKIGVAFQIQDDISDLDSETAVRHQNTYPSRFGESAAAARVMHLYEEALSHLADWGEKASFLRALTQSVVLRNR